MTKNIEVVDARGLGCPQPVILAKKAVARHERIVVLVDNDAAAENVKRMGTRNGCDVQIEKLGAGRISNMYDIVDLLSRAGRLVAP